jgi:hypothetical protein
MSETKKGCDCGHDGRGFKRLGVLVEGQTKYYLLVCEGCGTTTSTRTLRARKELRRTYLASLTLI